MLRLLAILSCRGAAKGALALPDRGLGGHENFADRDLEKNGRSFFLFVSWLVLKGPGACALPGDRPIFLKGHFIFAAWWGW